MSISKYPITLLDDGEAKLLGETEHFRLYECALPDGAGVGILKIAATIQDNSVLDREAFILQMMKDKAEELEAKYRADKHDDTRTPNYQICFPNLVESFISEEQGGRRVVVVSLLGAEDDIGRFVPLSHIISRDRVRIDPKTSAWIMGKFLKLIAFLHDQGISLGFAEGENFLIERKEHYVLFFDFTDAVVHPDNKVPERIAREEISQLAKEVMLVLGGDPDTGKIPPNDQDSDGRYASHIFYLAWGGEQNAGIAHTKFYELVRSLWPSKYWPFTSHPLERR